MILSLPFPPSEIHPGSLLLQEHLARLLSLFFLYSPSPPVSVYSAYPLQCLVPPIVRPSESYQPSGFGRPMSSSVFPTQRPKCRFAPPPTCAAGGTWLGCGWRGKGDGAPRDGLESFVSSFVARESVPSLTLEFPLDSCSARLSVCPPPPLPLSPYNRTCPSTLPPNGRVFLWSLRAPLPCWTRPSCRLF